MGKFFYYRGVRHSMVVFRTQDIVGI